MIAKYRKDGYPGEWWLTDFTMEQVERRIGDLEFQLNALKEAVKNGFDLDVEMLSRKGVGFLPEIDDGRYQEFRDRAKEQWRVIRKMVRWEPKKERLHEYNR